MCYLSHMVLKIFDGEAMKHFTWLLLLLLLALIAACQPSKPACPPGSIFYFTDISTLLNVSSQEIAEVETQLVEIKGREVQVDRIINGTLCNGSWRGTVYVPCEIQILDWDENPTFLEKCELDIEPGTVVYVAAHNDDPYYQGCSCHTGEKEN